MQGADGAQALNVLDLTMESVAEFMDTAELLRLALLARPIRDGLRQATRRTTKPLRQWGIPESATRGAAPGTLTLTAQSQWGRWGGLVNDGAAQIAVEAVVDLDDGQRSGLAAEAEARPEAVASALVLAAAGAAGMDVEEELLPMADASEHPVVAQFADAALSHGLTLGNARLVAGVLALSPWDPNAHQAASIVRCAQHVVHSLRNNLGSQDAQVHTHDAWPLARVDVLHLVLETLGPQVHAVVTAAMIDLSPVQSRGWVTSAHGHVADVAWGTWGTLTLAVLCTPGGMGVQDLVGRLWKLSALGPSMRLSRSDVREWVQAMLLLVRHGEASGVLGVEALSDLHTALATRLEFEEARDENNALLVVQSVPERRSVAIPRPARDLLDHHLHELLDGAVRMTSEQIKIIQEVVPFTLSDVGELVYERPLPNIVQRVLAAAGTGKTTTLRLLAMAHPDLLFLYCCFNKEAANRADDTFPHNVTAATTHRLASSVRELLIQAGKQLRTPFKKESRDYLAGVFNNPSIPYDRVDLAIKTVERFMTSSDAAIAQHHVPVDMPWGMQGQPTVLQMAQALWPAMTNPHSVPIPNTNRTINLPAPHNAYLKKFTLDNPILMDAGGRPYDVILVDEAQDINEVTLQLLLNQPCLKVLVGDQHQHIYGFNHCVNALGATGPQLMAQAGHVSRAAIPRGDQAARHLAEMLDDQYSAGGEWALTRSFRMGPDLVAVANRVLEEVGETR